MAYHQICWRFTGTFLLAKSGCILLKYVKSHFGGSPSRMWEALVRLDPSQCFSWTGMEYFANLFQNYCVYSMWIGDHVDRTWTWFSQIVAATPHVTWQTICIFKTEESFSSIFWYVMCIILNRRNWPFHRVYTSFWACVQ